MRRLRHAQSVARPRRKRRVAGGRGGGPSRSRRARHRRVESSGLTPFLLPALPGFYQVTPPQNATVTFTHYPDVRPFIIGDRLQFRSAPPPALTSERYATDFNEVKALGGTTSTVRTAEQTSIAQRWAAIGTSTQFQMVWNNLLRDLARQGNLSALDTARAYALLSMAMHDGLLVSFDGKFLYGLWRPVTAIREADRDDNPATAADPTWLSLIPNPPYPTYPGNMTCMGAVASARCSASSAATTRGFGDMDRDRGQRGHHAVLQRVARARR